MYKMSDDQEEHLGQIVSYYLNEYPRRYRRGAKDHKTKLWEYDDDWYIDNAIEEMLDGLAYLITLKQNKKKRDADSKRNG